MLSEQQNRKLTQVGPGTPGGDLLRRYWHPVAPATVFHKKPVNKVRLLGENLTLYRDKSGKMGLIAERCPHRMTSLHLGIPEPEGLRCCYHGWLFNEEGRCLDTPLERPDSPLKSNIKITAYPVQEMGGLIWAYMGPAPAPLLPRWDLFSNPNSFRHLIGHQLPCNWLQVMENRSDIDHTVYLHGRLFQHVLEQQGRLTDDPMARYNSTMNSQKASLERGSYHRHRVLPNELGFTKAYMAPGDSEEATHWTVGITPVAFPYLLMSGPHDKNIRRFYQMGVPIDDTHTWHITVLGFYFPEGVNVPKQDFTPYKEVPLTNDQNEYVLDYILAQDMTAWVEQGAIADRTQEHLGGSDEAVIYYRRLLSEQIDLVQQGLEPMNVFRTGNVDSLELTLPGADSADPFEGTSVGALLASRNAFHKQSKGGWLYIDDDGDRYLDDRDLIVTLFAEAERIQQQAVEA
jgi:5,5'-dehydrodivanillate O-demethylase